MFSKVADWVADQIFLQTMSYNTNTNQKPVRAD